MSGVEDHRRYEDLVKLGVLSPGLFRVEEGAVVFDPISVDDYGGRLQRGDVEELAYHTRSMRRGIFTPGNDGEVINYKGVDSAAMADDVLIRNLSSVLGRQQDRHEVVVTYFEHGSYRGHPKNPQIRVKGASQLQDLIKENDQIERFGKSGLIRFPRFSDVKVLSPEFCSEYALPVQVGAGDEFIRSLEIADQKDSRSGKSGYPRARCLNQFQHAGIPSNTRVQTWSEYFDALPASGRKALSGVPGLEVAIREEDGRYELGAAFGQVTRILTDPFRIADLEYYLRHQLSESVAAILDHGREVRRREYLLDYASTMGRNTAGLMNEGLANHLWSHRQDFSLSAEMCDDAFNDVRSNLSRDDVDGEYRRIKDELERRAGRPVDSQADRERFDFVRNVTIDKVKYYAQIFIFASNMKVIESAYQLLGRDCPRGYQDAFIQAFIDGLDEKSETLAQILFWGERLFGENGKLVHYLGQRAVNTMQGFEVYTADFIAELSRAASEYLH